MLRVGALYAGASWLLVQVATQVFPFFDIPNWAVRWVVIATVIGFPVALILSWFYELTPQGLKLESEIAADRTIERSHRGKLDRWIIAVLSLAVVVLLTSLFVKREDAPEADKQTGRSIAVLPFESLSDDKANAYFALGIQDEILTRLSKIGALRVISRTSTARYSSNPDNLTEIADKLGVDHVLEGSVQKAGDSVRINVQLIHAASDAHVWAETYERKLDDVFSVEGEVAQAIAEALNTKLSGAEHQALSHLPTRNPEAYDAYLRGLSYETRYVGDAYSDAYRHYKKAVAADPEFALAWAHLAMVQSYRYLNGYDHTAEALAEIKAAADKSMQLQPELGEAWLARGYYEYRGRSDYDAAIAAFEAASRRLPNSGEAIAAIAYTQRRQAKWNEALANLQKAAQIDPQNISYITAIAEIYHSLHRYGETQAAIDRAIELAPDRPELRGQKADYYRSAGDLVSAQKIIDGLPDTPDLVMYRAQLKLFQRDYASLVTLTRRMLALHDIDMGDQLPSLYSLLGASLLFSRQKDLAREAFLESRRLALELRKRGADSLSLAGNLGLTEAGLGNREAALAEARRCVELAGPDRYMQPQTQVMKAQIEALAGEQESAIAVLPKLLREPGGVHIGDLRYSPIWDQLRGDPRFAALIAEH